MEFADLISDLTRPEAYPHRAPHVDFIETHISAVFLAGDHAYKVKKPVKLPFLDFSSLERRRHYCEEEVRLNERLAPSVYRGLQPIVRGPDGHLRVGIDGDLLEYAVEMERLPQDRMLEHCLERGEIDNELLNQLAVILTDFHREANTGPGVDEHGDPAAVARNARENFEALRPHTEGIRDAQRLVSPRLLEYLEGWSQRFLDDHRALLRARVAGGRIREGHGDLHTGNICLLPGRIVIYDRIEFAPRFRSGDVAADLAFLAMDLDLRCYRAFSRYLVRRYGLQADDPEIDTLMDFYKSYRALVRAKVAAIRMTGATSPIAAAAARGEAQRYLHLATSYTRPCALFMTCGLPGTGKSFAARALARPFEARILRSDIERRRGGETTSTARAALGTGRYSREEKRKVYERMRLKAQKTLARGRSVVVDATFAYRDDRAPFLALGRELGVPTGVIHITVAPEVVQARMKERAADEAEPSEAGYEVYEYLAEEFEIPTEVPPHQLVEISGSLATEDLVSRALEALIGP